MSDINWRDSDGRAAKDWRLGQALYEGKITDFKSLGITYRAARMLMTNYEVYQPLGMTEDLAFEYTQMYAMIPLAGRENLPCLKPLAREFGVRGIAEDFRKSKIISKILKFRKNNVRRKNRRVLSRSNFLTTNLALITMIACGLMSVRNHLLFENKINGAVDVSMSWGSHAQ
ncbi:MAG TPA: hypothetical protein PKC28_13345 [Bdellovibrionales bacterium]|nr:hypothetical protein [Bdellovibrionales bacterium]